MPQNRFNLPHLGYGMGLRTNHYDDILDTWPQVDWFEVISENFMDTDGRPKRILERIREHYPVVMHGVSMSIGSTDPWNKDYFDKLKKLADWLNPPWISDHLCWTGVAHKNSHDLLPVPYTEESLKHLVARIKQVQDFLERPLLIENPSTYMEFSDSSMPEYEFLARMAEEADCALLLDANNVYVSCYNHRYDTKDYLDALPTDRVVQIHLAGHENQGTHIVDTHDGPVIDEVWAIYRYIISQTGPVSTMVEWDDKIPEFSVLQAEVSKAKTWAESNNAPNNLPSMLTQKNQGTPTGQPFGSLMTTMLDTIISGDVAGSQPNAWILPKPEFPQEKQIAVYVDGYRYRLFDVAEEEYPVLRYFLGDDYFDTLMHAYIEAQPSTSFNISHYIYQFPAFIARYKGLTEHHAMAVEICELETALAKIFDQTETTPLPSDYFTDKDPESLLSTTLLLRSALVFYNFEYPVNAFYNAVMEDSNPVAPAPEKSWIIAYRHEDRLWRLDVEHEEYVMLNLIAEGKTISEAFDVLLSCDDIDVEHAAANIQRYFARWMNNSLFTSPKKNTKSVA